MSGIVRVLVRAILRLFPEDVEGVSRSEMEETFFDAYVRQGSRGRAFQFLLREIPNVAAHGLGARFSAGVPPMIGSGLGGDLRFALKALRGRPALSLGALLMLSLGIGVNTAAFSMANGEAHIVNRFEEPDRLVFLWGVEPGWDRAPVPASEYLAWRERTTAFEDVGCYLHAFRYLTGSGEPLRVRVARTSVNLLPMLGLEPEMGRLFGPVDEDPSAPEVVILTHRLWQQRYGGRPDIVGQSLLLDEVPHTIVGVLPASVEFEMLWREVSLFLPMPLDEGMVARDEPRVGVMARLADNTTLSGAEAQITTVATRLAEARPDSDSPTRVRAEPFREFFFSLDDRLTWAAILTAVSAVLLIACVNLANLLLARGVMRQGEIAVRKAMGASGGRIARQLFLESLTLALVGGALGIAVGQWALSLLVSSGSPTPVLREDIGLNLPLLSYTFAVSLASALAFGLTPALLGARAPLAQSLKESSPGASTGRRRTRFRNWLLTAQIALVVPLVLACAGSFLNVRALQRTDFGFSVENVNTAEVSPPTYRYPDVAQRAQLFREIVEAVKGVPGVTNAAAGPGLPIGPGPERAYAPLLVEGREEMEGDARGPGGYLTVSPEYFATLGVPFRSGRGFNAGDGPGGGAVAVVNEAFARLYWPDSDPLGKRVFPETDPARTYSGYPFEAGEPIEVVGVVADFGATFHGDPPGPALYLPLEQHPGFSQTLVVRTAGAMPNLASAIRAAVASVDPGVPVDRLSTGEGTVEDWLRESRAVGTAVGFIALLALGMAVLGLYGMVAHSTARRTFELGVRIALGAGAVQVRFSVMRTFLAHAAMGLFVGVLISVAAGMMASSFLVLLQVSYVPMTLGITGLLASVVVLATYLPARRATLIAPSVALRTE